MPIPFTLLAKPAGASCNLACAYCFYLEKDRLYQGSALRMTDRVLKAYIRQLLHSQPLGEETVSWQGGDPTLMGLDFFRRSIKLVNSYKRPGQHVAYSLQTNGILLDDAWCAFFKEKNFLIGLSLDGPQEMHDAYRVDKGGRGTFQQVRKAWDLLCEYGVETNILCTVHAANAGHPLQVYRFFRDELGAQFIQFIPIVEKIGGQAVADPVQVSSRSVRPEEYGDFLIAVFDEWLQRDVGTLFVQAFDSALAAWCGLPASVCIHQEICGSSLVLEHNGDLYACDHFVDSPHRLGNIMETPLKELADSQAQRLFGLEKRQGLPSACRDCDVLFACHGECPRNRFIHSLQGEARLNYLCAGYKAFFHHIDAPMRKMAGLLRRGRSAAEIMQI